MKKLTWRVRAGVAGMVALAGTGALALTGIAGDVAAPPAHAAICVGGECAQPPSLPDPGGIAQRIVGVFCPFGLPICDPNGITRGAPLPELPQLPVGPSLPALLRRVPVNRG